MSEVKRCPKCREVKPISEFEARRDRPDKVLPGCKECRKSKQQEKRLASQARQREKRSTMSRNTSPMKRSQLRPVSKKRLEINAKRKEIMIAHFGDPRTWKCQIGHLIGDRCFGAVHGHELLSRARAGRTDENLLDVSGIVLACDYHNGWIEDNPKKAHELGLSLHAWEAKPKKKPTE